MINEYGDYMKAINHINCADNVSFTSEGTFLHGTFLHVLVLCC